MRCRVPICNNLSDGQDALCSACRHVVKRDDTPASSPATNAALGKAFVAVCDMLEAMTPELRARVVRAVTVLYDIPPPRN